MSSTLDFLHSASRRMALAKNMAGLNNTDLKQIDARINAATTLLGERIARDIALLRPRGWKKALHLLREWSVLGVTATTIVALLALVLTHWNIANNRLASDAVFQSKTKIGRAHV